MYAGEPASSSTTSSIRRARWSRPSTPCWPQGATAVYACASHAVLSGPAIDNIANSPLKELVVANTIPLREEAQRLAKIKVLSIAGLLGRAIESIHMETSVSTLFN